MILRKFSFNSKRKAKILLPSSKKKKNLSQCTSFLHVALHDYADYLFCILEYNDHSVKSVPIRSFSDPYFGLTTERYKVSLYMRENTNQKNSEYGYFLGSG